MKKLLIVVDMQNDFIDGNLGSKDAIAIVPKIKKKVEEYYNSNNDIIFTKDTHDKDTYTSTLEGKRLPVPHCYEGSHGWEISKEIDLPNENNEKRLVKHCLKNTFGYEDWEFEIRDLYDEIEIVGLDTDICVVSNALAIRMFFPNQKITVDASCCAGSTRERHLAALEVMKSCQIDVINEGV